MKIETHPQEEHQITLTVTLEAAQMESAKRRAARRLSERHKIPGFRPGKAPYEIVVRTFGEGAVIEEAIDLLLDEIYPKALDEAKINTGGPGTLKNIENLEGAPVFTFSVPLAPEVELNDYRSVRIPYEWQPPDETEVEKRLAEIQRLHAKTETVERPIQTNDYVLLDLVGKRIEGETEGETLIERKSMPVFIYDEERPNEWPYPGFNRELIGAVPGEIRSFTHTFPEDHPDEKLRGQTVRFEASIRIVRGTILPELNDDFARQVGPFENLEALRGVLRADLAQQSRAKYDDEYVEKVLKAIQEQAVIRYAPQTLEHEMEHLREDFEEMLFKRGLTLEAYLKTRDMDESRFMAEEIRPMAQRSLERNLLLLEIAQREKITVGEEDLNRAFGQILLERSEEDEDIQKYLNGKGKLPRRLTEQLGTEAFLRAHGQLLFERIKAIGMGEAPDLESSAVEPKNSTGESAVSEQMAGEATPVVTSEGGQTAEASSSASDESPSVSS